MKQAEIDQRLKELDAERDRLVGLRRSSRHRDEYERIIRQRAAKRRVAIQNAKDRANPTQTAGLLVELAYRLQNGATLAYGEREYLAHVLLAVVCNPRRAGVAFGLTRANHRPRSRDVEIRNLAMVVRVEELSAAMPIHLGRKGTSAVERTASEFGVSADVVEDALKHAWRK